MIDVESLPDIKGLTVEQAEEQLKELGVSRIRVLEEDGETFMGTMDWQPTRLNVAVEKGLISGILKFG